jgi:hypothetical protein
MVSVTEDQNTAEQVFQSFREVADGKVSFTNSSVLSRPSWLTYMDFQPYVTELDLRHSLIPDEIIEHLVKTMPQHQGPDLLEDRDLTKYDYISFMEKMMDKHSEGQNHAAINGSD